jgi:membrane protein implicated in regulation of membrane protease activity
MDLFVVYVACFAFGLLFSIVSAFFSGVFGGHEIPSHPEIHSGHVEAGLGEHDLPGFSPISPTTISTFITAFGGFGMVFSRLPGTQSPYLNIPLSLGGAFGAAAGAFWIFNALFRNVQGSSEGRVGELAGSEASVITPIPVNGVGEISYVQRGSRYTAPARADQPGEEVRAGSTVRIVRIVGSQFYVQKI